MSRIEDMIRDLCPEGVKWVKLGEVCEIKGRIGFRGYTRDDQVNEGEGALSLSPSNIQNGHMEYSKGTYITWEKYEESPEIMTFNGDIIFCKTASIGKVALVKNLPCKATINPQLVVLKGIKCNAPYLAYVLESDQIQNVVFSMAGTGSVPNISQKALSSIEIPLPPLPIQEKIVEILEKFSLLSAELEAELEGRRKQYDYYRNRLLSFDSESDSVVWKALGEIACYAKSRISLDEVDEDNYVGVENLLQNKLGKTISTSVPTSGNCIEYIEGDILIGNIRPYLKKIWLADRRGGTNGDVLTIRILPEFSKGILPRYLFHLLSSEEFFNYDNQYAKGAKMPRGDKNAVLKYSIPVPPLAEQERIVRILDKFEALVTDLSAGLPAEIERVQKQYEYYRNKLLTF